MGHVPMLPLYRYIWTIAGVWVGCPQVSWVDGGGPWADGPLQPPRSPTQHSSIAPVSSLSRAAASRVTASRRNTMKTETQNHFRDAQVNVKSESFSIKCHFLLTS